METSKVLLLLIEAADQLRVFHWQTTSYPEHVALGALYEKTADVTDDIAEALIGATERPQLAETIQLVDYSEGSPLKYVQAFAKELEGITGLPTDILNMRDDLLGVVHKTAYLLTLSAPAPEQEQPTGEETLGDQPEAPSPASASSAESGEDSGAAEVPAAAVPQ
jgi:DNA-binding ferritin-like protein